VTSELVTNAVQHSLCRKDERLIIGISFSARARISVLDPGRAGRQANPVDRPPTAGGMGLKIVGNLASSWGSHRHSHGYEVWAELPALS
jgi:anti-sigma regulatory factor (Ser/Thr protein kinase)